MAEKKLKKPLELLVRKPLELKRNIMGEKKKVKKKLSKAPELRKHDSSVFSVIIIKYSF